MYRLEHSAATVPRMLFTADASDSTGELDCCIQVEGAFVGDSVLSFDVRSTPQGT